MSNVLFIKANDRPADQAVSVQMYETFLKTYKDTHSSDVITELDLFVENLPTYGNRASIGIFPEQKLIQILTVLSNDNFHHKPCFFRSAYN
jgi:FMN-dependent NADH-azoreductase